MASDLLSIAKSGARTARIALDITAQNIANAATEGYVRRTAQLAEVAASGGIGRTGDVSLSGVRLDRVVRNADLFRQAEVRRTGSDEARAGAELAGLAGIETAIEQSGTFPAIVRFEGALQQLALDPVNPSLRAAVIEQASTMARALNLASSGLEAEGETLRFEAGDGVSQVNVLTAELARTNVRLSRSADGSSDQSALLDQRDLLLERISGHAGVTASIQPDQTVDVRLGGSSGPLLVTGGTAGTLAMATAPDGSISFTLDSNPATINAGSLAGTAQALTRLVAVRGSLDGIAANLISTLNTAQAAGSALDGTPGQPLFAGSGAGNIVVAFSDGALIATAPAGAGAQSRDPGNLTAMRSALSAANPAGAMDALIHDISGAINGRRVTHEALSVISQTARTALEAGAGVDLDAEAVNLVRFQQAFQASGRVMQVASDIFDTMLGIG